MARKIIKFNNLTWVNIDDFNQAERDFLKAEYKFHPLDMKDCFELEQNPKLDVYENYIFLILHFPQFNKSLNRISFDPIAVFLGKDFVITIHRKFKKMKKIFYLCQQNTKIKKDFLDYGSDYALYKLIHYFLSESSEPIVNSLKKRIKDIEVAIYEDKRRKKSVKAIAVVRRNILNLRSILEPQKFVLKSLSLLNRPEIINPDLKVYFDDINDYIDRVWMITSNHKELLDGLNETNESLISYQTNQIITTLTVISVALLPLTLFSSIYGMNIPLPFARQPGIVWFIYIAISLAILLTLLYLNKKNKI